MIMWLKYFKENTEVGTENGEPKRRGVPSFYWFPGFSIALPLPLFSVCLCLFSLSLSGGKIWRAPYPVIKLLPARWEREIHHTEALAHPANPHR